MLYQLIRTNLTTRTKTAEAEIDAASKADAVALLIEGRGRSLTAWGSAPPQGHLTGWDGLGGYCPGQGQAYYLQEVTA